MNDNQLKRNLNSVGKECFVAYFKQFDDLRLSNQDIAEQIQEDRGYTWKACQSRTGHARGIIRAGRARDALGIIRDSERIDQRIRDKAGRLAASMSSESRRLSVSSEAKEGVTPFALDEATRLLRMDAAHNPVLADYWRGDLNDDLIASP